ncbi:hypothetical protein OC842_007271 [Tilletia horrida]|uniref:Uncharacterized protein n=1 Tax=Tilletia horrida TaxID=155126 RepID=A0AAN6G5S9_9BASI|nr:hypothetical protein OC842_007271 [Tilletia horrida]
MPTAHQPSKHRPHPLGAGRPAPSSLLEVLVDMNKADQRALLPSNAASSGVPRAPHSQAAGAWVMMPPAAERNLCCTRVADGHELELGGLVLRATAE